MAHIEIVPDSSLPGTSQVRLQLPPGWSRFFALRNHGLHRTNEGSRARWALKAAPAALRRRCFRWLTSLAEAG